MKRLVISFLVSNIFNFLGTIVFGAIIASVIVIPQMQHVGTSTGAVVTYINTNKLVLWTVSGVGGLVSIASGYIGAWIARRKYLLMGALSATGCCIQIIFSLVKSGITVRVFLIQVLFFFVNILLGVIGGYLFMKLPIKKENKAA